MDFKSILAALAGSNPQFAVTPPFTPGGVPSISAQPGRTGLVQMLGDAFGSFSPNVAGGGATDIIRAVGGGMSAASRRRAQDQQMQLAAFELNRKAENDRSMAAARNAEAQKDLADAQARRELAMKRPQTPRDKYNELMQVPGMTPAQALAITSGNKNFSTDPNAGKIQVTPEVAKAGGIPLPTETKTAQVPTTDPTGDNRTVDFTRDIPGPVWVNANQGYKAMDARAAELRRGETTTSRRQPAPTLKATSNGEFKYFSLGPDGQPVVVPTGQALYQAPRRGKGDGDKEGRDFTRAKEGELESAKDKEFSRIKKEIEDDPRADPAALISRALDNQAWYEKQVQIAGGTLSPADIAAGRDSVRQMVLNHFAWAKDKKQPYPSSSSSRRGSPAPTATPVMTYIPGKGFQK